MDDGAAMAMEFREAPNVVRAQGSSQAALKELAARCRSRPPNLVVTCGRGSSAHAATFGKHLIERHLGIPVAAAAPNIASVYRQRLQLRDQLVLTISQSGRSDDLIEFNTMSKSAGAMTVAIVNDMDSPLAAICDVTLAMAAGPELSVAATKSFIATLAMLLRMTAEWKDDAALRDAIDRLPDRLAEAVDLDWSLPLEVLSKSNSLMTVGRGPTLAIAREAALKMKETCHLHAEAFSGAEFQHGPVTLVSHHYPIVMFMPTDAAAPAMWEFAAAVRAKGAEVFCTGNGESIVGHLPVVATDHPDTDPLCLIQTFYGMIRNLSILRGTDLDRPRHLQKVTRTR